MKRRNLLAALAVSVTLPAAQSRADDVKPTASDGPNGIVVDKVWARAAAAGRPTAVYLTITNTGLPDALTAISAPIAETAQIHESFAENGVMKMRPVATLPVTAEKPLTLAPGGYHVMLMGLRRPIVKGDSFPLTLSFEHAAPITVQARVESPGAGAPASTGASGHDADRHTPAPSHGGT